MDENEPSALLDRDEAAERLRVSRRTVVRYGRAGLLDERRIGPKLVRITEASVEALAGKAATK
jgi:excisionase family DNA binding protein